MRTFLGMKFRSSETSTLEQTSTKVAAMPMPETVLAEVVTARVGQRPSTSLEGRQYLPKAFGEFLHNDIGGLPYCTIWSRYFSRSPRA
jgi:hypothetical protein